MHICTVGGEENFTMISNVRKTDNWALIYSRVRTYCHQTLDPQILLPLDATQELLWFSSPRC